LDVRSPENFAISHLKGALNIAFNPSFCKWAGYMLPPTSAIGVVAENQHLASQVIENHRLMGFDQEIWTIILEFENPFIQSQLSSFPLLDAEDLLKNRSHLDSCYVLDVRTPSEWDEGHIDGAHHFDLSSLELSLNLLPFQQPIAVVCKSGARASLAASLLKKNGFSEVMNLKGGIMAWKQAGLPLIKSSASPK
jgi:hydroxyacylglutathione hydrolase